MKYSFSQDWDNGQSFQTKNRIWYTMFSSVVQYIMPLAVIIVLYYKIYIYLKVNKKMDILFLL